MPLTEYYERVGPKDNNALTILSFSERMLLNGILKAFVYGMRDSEVRKEAARGLASSDASLRSLYLAAESARRAQQEIKKLEEVDARIQELQYYKNLARERAQVDYLWGIIRGTSLPSEEKEISYETSCDLSDSEQVGSLWGVIRSTNLHTEVKELVYDTLWDMENLSIQPIPLVQPLIVPSTSPIWSTPPAQYLPIQPTSLVQATPPILPPPIQPVLIEPALSAQLLLTESASLPVQPISSVFKPALPFQTIGPGLPALPLVEPAPLASSVPVSCASAAPSIYFAYL